MFEVLSSAASHHVHASSYPTRLDIPTHFATILISGRDWFWPVLLLLTLALVILGLSYRRAPAQRPLRIACLALKLLGLLALALCILEPVSINQRAKPGANYFAVLVDNSQGLQLKDRDDTRTRAERLQNSLIAGEKSWLAKLHEDFQLRRYYFDTRLQATTDFDNLDYQGRATALGHALRSVADRFQTQPLAGILLLSDGNATDLSETDIDPTGLPPIYPVIVGNDHPIRDVAINRIAVRHTAFEDAPVTAQVDVNAAGYAGRSIVAQLRNIDGSLLEEITLRAPRNDEPMAFRFQFRPDRPGLSFHQLRVAAADDPTGANEATFANNERLLVVDRRGGPFRVLYVTGRPTWEFKFLNRGLAEDDQIDLVALVRMAEREPRFEFRGRAGESSNPLFRGFDRDSEEIERYDQPVLIRLYTRDSAELAGGFPKTAEDLYPYHAVILDDVEAAFFTQDQLALLQKFVAERGGGFLMLAGSHSFREGNYDRTPIGTMLPVYLDRATPITGNLSFQLELTREGWLQPWLRLRPTESAEQSRLQEMTRFRVLNSVRDVKPGASVLAIVNDHAGNTHPALVIHRYGLGRVGAWMIGDLWRWGLQNESAVADLQKAWRQTVRWLVTDVPERVFTDSRAVPADPNQAVQIQVRARDKLFQPLDNATVTLSVRHIPNPNSTSTNTPTPGTNSIQLTAEPSPGEPGLYTALFVPREPGGYHAESIVVDPHGVEAGRAETGWTADPAAAEFQSLNPNRTLMTSLARQTGGRVLPLSDLDRFVSQVPHHTAPITETWTQPLWHQPGVFIFALLCFITEWGLRRWKGLA